jgi:hypothetical protein
LVSIVVDIRFHFCWLILHEIEFSLYCIQRLLLGIFGECVCVCFFFLLRLRRRN